MFVGGSQAILRVQELIDKAARSGSTVLIIGESGVGKDVASNEIHIRSKRIGRFLAVNCAAIPGDPIESELFGHERGAFQSASRSGLRPKRRRALHAYPLRRRARSKSASSGCNPDASSRDEVVDKFGTLTKDVVDHDRIARIEDRVLNIEKLRNVKELIDLLGEPVELVFG